MFCKECGIENSETAELCKGCGKPLNNAETVRNNERDNSIKYNIKPTYNWGYKIVTIGLTSILLGLFIIFYMFEEYTAYIMKSYTGIIVLILGAYAGGRMLFEKLQYNKLNYNFYSDRVEYVDGFLNISEKELKYKFIREITMTQNIIERIFKIGTIRIFTNASSGRMNRWGSRNNMQGVNGIVIHCVENVREQYLKVKELTDDESRD